MGAFSSLFFFLFLVLSPLSVLLPPSSSLPLPSVVLAFCTHYFSELDILNVGYD